MTPPRDDKKPDDGVGPSGLTRAEIARKAAKRSAEVRAAKAEENARELLSEEELNTILAMAKVGVLRSQIAKYLRCSELWLRETYGPELDAAEVASVARVAQTLYTKATTGKDLGAAIFFLKVRGGWRENPEAFPREKEVDTTGALQRFTSLLDKWADSQRDKPETKENVKNAPVDSATSENGESRTGGVTRPTH